MAGKIPQDFIDQLLARVDIVEVIDRRVPLARKGKEYMARCPFHDEKTPSFTVSPTKQFYHCFGCGAHGTAIGFLMNYANLGFVEAVEELADRIGLPLPASGAGGKAASVDAGSTAPLYALVAEAGKWFQQQLRTEQGKPAIAYLKKRGLDGQVAADFGIGFAPDGWDNLLHALGTNQERQRQLLKAGLVAQRDKAGGGMYDRFRNRVIFPIEDHRGRMVGFGGRVIGEGEPKYLNSPETPLFHKGAELYGLHRARRAIGQAGRAIVVEGYMDVVSLAQFGVDNAVATLGTATTRTHLQRLFRVSAEIVFCFDGDRAGREAAWKALQTALSEMQDGRQLGFLFLPEGADPDSVVRDEGGEGFGARAAKATPLGDFLFDTLTAQVDMTRMDGRARLVAQAKPLLVQLPAGALREMMFARLASLSGLSVSQLEERESASSSARQTSPRRTGQRRADGPALGPGQLSPLALATSLLLQNPSLAGGIPDPGALGKLTIRGSKILIGLIQKITDDSDITTARLLEFFRDDPNHAYLEKLAARDHPIDQDALAPLFNDALARLLENHAEQRRLQMIEKIRQTPPGAEQQALKREMQAMLEARGESMNTDTDTGKPETGK